MNILKLSMDWARAESIFHKISLLLSLLFFIAAIGFWQLGKTEMAKAFLWPMLVAGIFVIAVSAGLYFANKPRITQFQTAYNTCDAKAFVQNRNRAYGKIFQNDLALVFKVTSPRYYCSSIVDHVCKHTLMAGYWDYYNCSNDCTDVY